MLHANQKTRKIHVLFLDDCPVNGQHLGQKLYVRYNKKTVLPFNHEQRKLFDETGKNLGKDEKEKFKGALSKISDYMTKRALGRIESCKVFLRDPISDDEPLEEDLAEPVLVPKKRRVKEKSAKEIRDRRIKKNEPIVEYICSNETKDFLSRLNKGEIDSERRTAFKEARYKYLRSMSAVGVIDDDTQVNIVDISSALNN